MRKIEICVYSIHELDAKAREVAISDFRESCDFDDYDIKTRFTRILEIVGYSDVDIRYSGFGNQGDGASFTGSFKKGEDILHRVKEEWNNHDLEMIIRDIIMNIPEDREFRIELNGRAIHYCHENTMGVKDYTEETYYPEIYKDMSSILLCSKELSRWFYKQLELEYEYQMSDEYILNQIVEHDYEYLVDGTVYKGL